MSTQPISALIISEPGPIQDGLWDLLSALPHVKLIGAVADPNEGVKIVKKKRPSLILLANHFKRGDIRSAVKEIKTADPRVICIVVASDVEQKKIASEAGADSVQMTGFPAGDLYYTIQQLLDMHAAG